MKVIYGTFLAVALIVFAGFSVMYYGRGPVSDTLAVRWEGAADSDMLQQARRDLTIAVEGGYKTLRVDFASPGGPAVTALEIARLVHLATQNGLTVEIHGHGIVASGATAILAAGTPGHRYVSEGTIVLVHGLQGGGGPFGPALCINRPEKPQSEDEKLFAVMIDEMARVMARYTGKSVPKVQGWLRCGQEQVGTAELAIKLGLADHKEA